MNSPAALEGTGYDPIVDYWVAFIRAGKDRFRTELTDPAVIAACGDVAGKIVLDLGCGEGYMARRFHSAGARHVVGVDISPRFVQVARATGPDGITFEAGDAASLDLPAGVFDLVVANHTLNDVEDVDQVFREIHRVLAPGGRAVALFLHPCFYWPRRGLGHGESWVAGYYQTTPRAQGFTVDDQPSPGEITAWYRPLEDYTRAVTAAGLCITGITEPHPSAETLATDEWWAGKWTRPMFMLLEATRR